MDVSAVKLCTTDKLEAESSAKNCGTSTFATLIAAIRANREHAVGIRTARAEQWTLRAASYAASRSNDSISPLTYDFTSMCYVLL
jgi:hypothetical protein